MCNELGRLPQGGKTNSGTDTIEFVLHKDKSKEIKETYVKAVFDIRPQKPETNRTIFTAEGNLIDHTGEVSTPMSDLTTIKMHVNSVISDIKYRYMCMEVKDFYLNNFMDRVEYIMIHISMIPSEFIIA